MKSNLLQEIENVFPFVEKPKGIDLARHKDDCLHCKFALHDIEEYTEAVLPKAGLLKIFNEMSALSPQGWCWVLPSYLRHCIKITVFYDNMETEFLIYNLGPAEEFHAEAIERFSLLNKEQISCLIHFLEWAETHEYWSTYCPEEIQKGLEFLKNKLA